MRISSFEHSVAWPSPHLVSDRANSRAFETLESYCLQRKSMFERINSTLRKEALICFFLSPFHGRIITRVRVEVGVNFFFNIVQT
jgi:hypothetical protein